MNSIGGFLFFYTLVPTTIVETKVFCQLLKSVKVLLKRQNGIEN